MTRKHLHAIWYETGIHVVHHMFHPSLPCLRLTKRSPGTCANSTYAGQACNSRCPEIKHDIVCTSRKPAKHCTALRAPDMFSCFGHCNKKQNLHTLFMNLGHALSMLVTHLCPHVDQNMLPCSYPYVSSCIHIHRHASRLPTQDHGTIYNVQPWIRSKKQDLYVQASSHYCSLANSNVGL